jgi:hypothetical protein
LNFRAFFPAKITRGVSVVVVISWVKTKVAFFVKFWWEKCPSPLARGQIEKTQAKVVFQ